MRMALLPMCSASETVSQGPEFPASLLWYFTSRLILLSLPPYISGAGRGGRWAATASLMAAVLGREGHRELAQGSGAPRTTASPSAGLQTQVSPLSQTMESLLLRTQGAFSLRWTHLHTRCRNERRPLWLYYSSESPSPYICMAP